MSERTAFITVLIAVGLGHRIAVEMGDRLFYPLLLLGLAVAVAWTLLAYRRGEKVFIWQRHNG